MRTIFTGVCVPIALIVASPAHAQQYDAITLECTGTDKPPSAAQGTFTRTYYINLTTRTFCTDRCVQSFSVADVRDDLIDLSWTYPPSSEEVRLNWTNQRTIFDRKSGQFRSDETTSGAALRERKLEGHCETAHLELAPVLEFLANAPNR